MVGAHAGAPGRGLCWRDGWLAGAGGMEPHGGAGAGQGAWGRMNPVPPSCPAGRSCTCLSGTF